MIDSSQPRDSASFSRRLILKTTAAAAVLAVVQRAGFGDEAAAANSRPPKIDIDSRLRKDWLARWEKSTLAGAKYDRYAEKETGEELGWLVSPYLNGFFYGYLATRDTKWLDLLVQWTDAWTSRGIKEPDGFVGWPKDDGASTPSIASSYTDSMLGEAMALKSAVLFAGEVRADSALRAKYGDKAASYLDLAEKTYAKWISREAWREVEKGGVWVIPEFGLDKANNRFTEGYENRKSTGFTLPDNKQNEITGWILALHDVTGKPEYRQRAENWFHIMRSRMNDRDGKYFVWNYWEPAGSWDYKPNHQTRHWVGVHPNGGYYFIDTDTIAAAFQHHLVFTRGDIDKLIATNRDFMWNRQVQHARFQRIDGDAPDKRWKDSPGVLWTGLVPYDAKLREIFEANHKPEGWGGVASTPWYLSLAKA